MQSARFPLLAALLLGLLVALNPCQLAINISALTYIHKNSINRKASIIKGITYAIGRAITYTSLGWALTYIISRSASIDSVRSALSKAEDFLPYILFAAGAFLIGKALFSRHHRHGDKCHNSGNAIEKKGAAGPLVLGIALAFAFCPESAIFYFGMLIPLSAGAEAGWAMPLAFAIAASIPVILLSVLISTAMQAARRFEKMFRNFQMWLNIATGIIFITIGLLL